MLRWMDQSSAAVSSECWHTSEITRLPARNNAGNGHPDSNLKIDFTWKNQGKTWNWRNDNGRWCSYCCCCCQDVKHHNIQTSSSSLSIVCPQQKIGIHCYWTRKPLFSGMDGALDFCLKSIELMLETEFKHAQFSWGRCSSSGRFFTNKNTNIFTKF